MISVLTKAEMEAIEKESIADTGQGLNQMKKAGQALFDLLETLVKPSSANDVLIFPSVTIVCGKGNNGGDGFMLASLLAKQKYELRCFALAKESDYQGEARQALDLFLAAKGRVVFVNDELSFLEFKQHIDKFKEGLIIDALLGIGGKGAPRGYYAGAIELINSCRERHKDSVKLIAVDLPSGMDLDTGNIYEPCLQADFTVTMGFPKLGFFFYPARAKVGHLVIRDLDYPQEIVTRNHGTKIFALSQSIFKRLLPKRKIDGSKFDHGLAVLVAGSQDMVGAVMLTAQAALRSGLGLLHVISDTTVLPVLVTNVWEAVLHPLSPSPEGDLQACIDIIEAKAAHVLAIGPGLSLSERKLKLVHALVGNVQLPIILDADGINAFKKQMHLLKRHKFQILITPHSREFARLFPDIDLTMQDPLQRVRSLQKLAQEYNMSILYKGSPTIVADPSGAAFILPYGNSGMATAGSGDVLTGIITGLAAQILCRKAAGAYSAEPQLSDLSKAAILGAYIHGMAGDIAVQKTSEYAMVARDLIDNIHEVFKLLTTKV
jgi:NAD(P)H-hydrate epimerase